METKIFIVRCKFCGNEQQCATKKELPVGVMKKCVYCEKRFCIHRSPKNSAIIRRIR